MSPENFSDLIGQLRSTLGKMEVALDSIADGIVWTDSQGQLQWCNKSFAQLMGRPSVLLLGQDVVELMPLLLEGKRIARSEHPIWQLDCEASAVAALYNFQQGERSFVFEISVSNVDFENALSSRVLVFHDVTEQRRAHERLVASQDELRQSLIATIGVIVKAVEVRDPYTSGHQHRVSCLARAIAQEMGLDHEHVEWIRLGAAIHDIGKLQVPSEILSKPGRISAMEFELIKGHAVVGYEILKDVKFPWPIADIAYQHHERLDGSGYPRGLKGDEICLEARIVAVADVLEAMSSHRPYRPAIGMDDALHEIVANRGRYYDPEVVDACCRLVEQGVISHNGGLSIEHQGG